MSTKQIANAFGQIIIIALVVGGIFIALMALTACGGSVATPSQASAPATEAQVAAQSIWVGQTSEEHVVTCQMYKSNKILIKEAIMTADDTYKGKTKEQRAEIASQFFALLDKEC